MICVDASRRKTFDNVSLWENKIRENSPNTPIMLVLTKTDLMDSCVDPVTVDEIQKLAQERGF